MAYAVAEGHGGSRRLGPSLPRMSWKKLEIASSKWPLGGAVTMSQH